MQLAYRFMWHGVEKRVVSIKWPQSSNHDKGELLKFSRSQSNAGYEGKQRNIRGCTTFWLSQNYMLKGPTKSCRSSYYERGARFIYNFKKIRNIHAVPNSRTHNSWPHHSLFFSWNLFINLGLSEGYMSNKSSRDIFWYIMYRFEQYS